MRAWEFITEGKKKSKKKTKKDSGLNVKGGTPRGKMKKRQKAALPSAHTVRDVGGYDRVYHLNRLAMAMGMADGKSSKPVDMDSGSWAEKYNTVHPFTEEEEMMVLSAINTIPSEYHREIKGHRSKEPESTDKNSLVKSFAGYGPKKKKK